MNRIKNMVAFLVIAILAACGGNRAGNNPGESRLVLPAAMCVPVSADTSWYSSGAKAPLFEGLGKTEFSINPKVPEAQRYFRQGLMLAFAFNHAEAARSFYEATRIDPGCAICYWGYAYVLGPNYNAGMEKENFGRAYDASRNALALSEYSSPEEKALIVALTARYAEDPPEDRSHLDQAYAEAMRKVYEQFPENNDVAVLFAESLLDLHPWDLYEPDGSPKAWTPEITAVLEKVMARAPDHPGAHHFYIHAVEASANPEIGLTSARTLGELVPGAGHLVHMPSHIFINTGHYHEGSLANIKAVRVDSSYVEACHAQGFYPLALYPHNYHFLATTATLEGNGKRAMDAAWKVSGKTNLNLMHDSAWAAVQHYYLIPYHVAVKFGKWDEILRMNNIDSTLTYPACTRHYARGMAWLGKGRTDMAREELTVLDSLMQDPEIKDMTIWSVNKVYDVVSISRDVLEGEILAREGNFEESVQILNRAAEVEDGLNYNEPPDWIFSVRHHLGAVLLEAGRFQEAIAVYHDDLLRFPSNGWALNGLYQAYAGAGQADNADHAREQFQAAWQWSDTPISSSRILN